MPWRPLQRDVFDTLRMRYRWILLVGDSDTRGLAFSLLQMLAEAINGREIAEATPSLWLGHPPPRESGANASEVGSRLCHLDWQYDAHGTILASRTIPCLLATQKEPGRRPIYNPLGYSLLGEEFELALPLTSVQGLRVTLVTISTPGSFVKVMHYLVRHAAMQLPYEPLRQRRRPRQIGVMFNVGAWSPADQPVPTVAAAANAAADAMGRWINVIAIANNTAPGLIGEFPPETRAKRVTAVWATTLGLHRRNRSFADKVAALLVPNGHVNADVNTPPTDPPRSHQQWQLLNRSSELARVASDAGRQGVKLSNGHAPHGINWIDNQRLLHALLDDSGERCHRLHLPLTMSASCLGLKAGGRNVFIKAWQQWCAVDW